MTKFNSEDHSNPNIADILKSITAQFIRFAAYKNTRKRMNPVQGNYTANA